MNTPDNRVDFDWGGFARTAFLTTCIVASGLPLVNRFGTRRVVEALFFGNRVDCAGGVTAQNPNFPFDAIVVLGAGAVETADGNFEPNFAGKKRIAGAIEAYEKGFAPRVVLVGDAIGGERYLQIPREAVVVAPGGSINTATDVARLAELSRQFGWRRVIIPDSLSHGDRSTQFACNYGLAASWFPAHLDASDTKEKVELLETIVDPWGVLPTVAKWITLSR